MNFKENKSEDLLSGSKDKEMISLKEEIKNLQMHYDQVFAQHQTNVDKLFTEISALYRNAALWEAKEINEQEKIQHFNQIESLRNELVNKTKCLKDELEHAHYDINIQCAEVTFLKKKVKRLGDSLSKAMNQEKSNVQEIAKHVIAIEHLKSELAREMLNSRCDGKLHEKKDQMINLDDIKVKVDEFNRMKDMIRNNLEVNCLNVTFE